MIPFCDVEAAPDLPGMIRVTLVFEDGDGATAYFDPAQLPDLMRSIDRLKEGHGKDPGQILIQLLKIIRDPALAGSARPASTILQIRAHHGQTRKGRGNTGLGRPGTGTV